MSREEGQAAQADLPFLFVQEGNSNRVNPDNGFVVEANPAFTMDNTRVSQ